MYYLPVKTLGEDERAEEKPFEEEPYVDGTGGRLFVKVVRPHSDQARCVAATRAV